LIKSLIVLFVLMLNILPSLKMTPFSSGLSASFARL
jgi:hypothetical protein